MTRRAASALAIAAALALDVWACAHLAPLMGATNDLFPRWLAVRLWIERGWSPYSPETDAAIRAAMGSVPLGGEAFVFGFVYPGYVAPLLAPLALLPFETAATIWLLLTQACCVGGTLLCWRALERERGLAPAPALPPMLVGALLPSTVMNVLFLQLAAPVFAALAASWWLATRHRAWAAGLAVTLAAVKPALAVGPVAALMVTARSGRFAAGAVGGTVLWWAVSLVLLPGWPLEFWRSTVNYAAAAQPRSAAGVVGEALGFGLIGGLGVCAVAVALTVYAWRRSTRRMGDTLTAGVLASIWLVPPLYEWNNVVLLVPVIQALRLTCDRAGRPNRLLLLVLASAAAATAVVYALWPSEARAVWPVVALALFVWTSRRCAAATYPAASATPSGANPHQPASPAAPPSVFPMPPEPSAGRTKSPTVD
jgi:hypothetical protein